GSCTVGVVARTSRVRDLERNGIVERTFTGEPRIRVGRHEEVILRSASPLEDQGFIVTQRAVTPVADEHAVASVLVISAPDLESAVELARRHPGLAFGTEIELRPVKTVAPPPR